MERGQQQQQPQQQQQQQKQQQQQQQQKQQQQQQQQQTTTLMERGHRLTTGPSQPRCRAWPVSTPRAPCGRPPTSVRSPRGCAPVPCLRSSVWTSCSQEICSRCRR